MHVCLTWSISCLGFRSLSFEIKLLLKPCRKFSVEQFFMIDFFRNINLIVLDKVFEVQEQFLERGGLADDFFLEGLGEFSLLAFFFNY